jgi:hypothetical protein
MSSRRAALEILREGHLFEFLRALFFATGPASEVKLGIGIFLVLASRFLPNPLRLLIDQTTKGSATHLVRRVTDLLPGGAVAGFSGNMAGAWRKFANDPTMKVFYIPPPLEMSVEVQPKIAVQANRLIRVDSAELDGQTTEKRRDIERPFVCISTEPVADWKEQSRWLKIRLAAPLTNETHKKRGLQTTELSVWHAIQNQIEERMQLPFQMPAWEELVLERMCSNEYASRSIPAILVSWKTMCALLSFRPQDERDPPKVLSPDFADYAATAAVLRAAFQEGRTVPSAKSVFNQISAKGSKCSVVNPITGGGARLWHAPDPVQYEPLFQMVG